MARGLSRDQSREKTLKKNAEKGKGQRDDNLTPQQRNERDAKLMAEKKAAKEKAKAEGAISADQTAEEEARKAKLRAEAKERREQRAQQCIPRAAR